MRKEQNSDDATGHETSIQLVSSITNLAKNVWISTEAAHPYPAKYSDEHESQSGLAPNKR